MAHYISKEELNRIDREREVEDADKSWTDLDIRTQQELSEREKRRIAREEKKKEQDRITVQIQRKREEERQKRMELYRKKKEAAERERMRKESEENKLAEKRRLLELARKKKEAEQRKKKRLEERDKERIRIEAEDREMMRLDVDHRERMRIEEKHGERRLDAEGRVRNIQETGKRDSRKQEEKDGEHRELDEGGVELRGIGAELDKTHKRRPIPEETLEMSKSREDDFELNVSALQLDYYDVFSETNADSELGMSHHMVGRPVDNSTDVESDNLPRESHGNDELPTDTLDRELFWLDRKLQEMKDSAKKNRMLSRLEECSRDTSRYTNLPQSKPKQTMTGKEIDYFSHSQLPKQPKKENDDTQIKKERGPDYPNVSYTGMTSNDQVEDEIERKLKEKISRLQKKDKDMSFRIEDMKEKKEKEMRKRMEQKLREERIKRLKEQERSLVDSLREKESVLSELETSYREETEKYHRERKGKEDQTDIHQKHEMKDANNRREKDERKYEDHRNAVSFRKPTIPKLTEDAFEEWKTEVEVVLKSGLYHTDIVRQEVRNSLSGNTRKILLNLNPCASTEDLITKLENVYGNIRSGESVLSEFYQAKQKEKENVAEWGVRVESILNTAIKKGQVMRDQADEMLRNRFWRHLKSDQLKNATRVFYETADNFEDLRKKVRIEENEIKATKESERETEKHEKQVTSHQRSDNDEQLNLMKSLLSRMEKLESQISKQSKQNENTKQEHLNRETVRNERRDDGPRRGYWNNRGSRYNRGGYRNRGYRGNYHSNTDTNKEHHPKENDMNEQSQESRASQESGDRRGQKREEENLN